MRPLTYARPPTRPRGTGGSSFGSGCPLSANNVLVVTVHTAFIACTKKVGRVLKMHVHVHSWITESHSYGTSLAI